MARKVQAVTDRVQQLLNDARGVRYPLDQLRGYVVDAVVEARSVRPDLFVGEYAVPLPDTLEQDDPLPLPDQFFAAVCMYVAGIAELRDDEFAVDGRAMTLQQMFARKLTTGV